MFVDEVARASPVKRQVGERTLASPPAWNVEVEDQFLHILADLFVRHGVQSNEGRHVGVEGGECLRTCPLILQGAQEVDDLP